MAKGREAFRFAVGKPEGPQSHVWLLWTAKNSSDVYITGHGFRRPGVLRAGTERYDPPDAAWEAL